MSPHPVLVFVSGAWHSPAHFAKLTAHLTATHGYTCLTTPLPSVNPASPSTITIEDDISAIRTFVLSTLEITGRNIVLIAHSYGAIPALSAVAGLSSTTLGSNKPHVQAIALICSFLLPPQTSSLDPRNGERAPLHNVSSDELTVTVGAEGPEYHFYGDIPPAEAAQYASLLKPHSWRCITGRPSQESVGFFDIPTSYLVCENDRAIPAAFQRKMIADADALLEKRGSELRIQVEECESSHSPFLSMPERTGEYIRRAAGEDVPKV